MGEDPADLLKNVKYGFRADPMEWVANDRTFEGAVVRTSILRRPGPGDRELIEERAAPLLAAQEEDGLWPKEHSGIVNHTREATAVETVGALLSLGLGPGRPEIRKAVDIVCRRELEQEGKLEGGALKLACLTGWRDGDEPARSMREFAGRFGAGSGKPRAADAAEPATSGDCPARLGGAKRRTVSTKPPRSRLPAGRFDSGPAVEADLVGRAAGQALVRAAPVVVLDDQPGLFGPSRPNRDEPERLAVLVLPFVIGMCT